MNSIMRWNRRATAAIVFSFVLSQTAGAAAKEGRPNILLIITDQQQAGMMSCTGNPWVKTPNLDRLASGGARFEKAYCTNPVCIPSRFSLFTGRMPSVIGMEDNEDARNPVSREILDHAMGTVFRDAGYRTAYAGKMHLPGQQDVLDNVAAYGFEERLAPRDNEGREPAVEACEAFLKTPHDKPFLLVASLINPHDICHLPLRDFMTASNITTNTVDRAAPLALAEVDAAIKFPPGVSEQEFFEKLCPPLPPNHPVPEKELTAYMAAHRDDYLGWTRENYDDRQWRIYRWVYDRLTERVDAQIGRILNALGEAGLEENTLVVFTSDHGEQAGSHRAATKGFLYEESVRIPFLVKWEGVTKPGCVNTDDLVSNGLDLIPTLCDFANIPAPAALRGSSVRPLAEGRTVRDWRRDLVVENNSSRLVRFGSWKYTVGRLEATSSEASKKSSGDQPVREALFDLSGDPGEMHNLASDPAFLPKLREGRSLLKNWYSVRGLKLDPDYIAGE